MNVLINTPMMKQNGKLTVKRWVVNGTINYLLWTRDMIGIDLIVKIQGAIKKEVKRSFVNNLKNPAGIKRGFLLPLFIESILLVKN